jgi:membrane associated rhomboid family serine protease
MIRSCGAILAEPHHASETGALDRLKMYDDDDCRRAFYDGNVERFVLESFRIGQDGAVKLLLTCLYDVGLYAAYVAGAMHLRARPAESRRDVGRPPRATVVLMLAIAVVTTLQFFFPAVLVMFERDYSRFAAGEWWRLITALFAQDGGWSGGLVNLVGLVLVGGVAERLWGGRRWLVFFFVGGVISEVIALAWQPIGAGNSVANFSLAAGVVVVCLVSDPSRLVLVTALLALGADAWLLYLKNVHGAAALVGVVLAIALIAFERARRPTLRSR